jgi:hypothetical protein
VTDILDVYDFVVQIDHVNPHKHLEFVRQNARSIQAHTRQELGDLAAQCQEISSTLNRTAVVRRDHSN